MLMGLREVCVYCFVKSSLELESIDHGMLTSFYRKQTHFTPRRTGYGTTAPESAGFFCGGSGW